MEKIKVLMIDDNINLVEMVKEYFKGNKNIEIALTAHDGQEGLKLVEQEQGKYDVVLLDLIMPKKDGLYVNVKAYIRVVYYTHGKVVSKLEKNTYLFHKVTDEILELKDGVNYLKCPYCGGDIDAEKGRCSYCHKEINRLQKWMLLK